MVTWLPYKRGKINSGAPDPDAVVFILASLYISSEKSMSEARADSNAQLFNIWESAEMLAIFKNLQL